MGAGIPISPMLGKARHHSWQCYVGPFPCPTATPGPKPPPSSTYSSPLPPFPSEPSLPPAPHAALPGMGIPCRGFPCRCWQRGCLLWTQFGVTSREFSHSSAKAFPAALGMSGLGGTSSSAPLAAWRRRQYGQGTAGVGHRDGRGASMARVCWEEGH